MHEEKQQRQSHAIQSPKKGRNKLNINVNTDSGVWCVSVQDAALCCCGQLLHAATEFEFWGSSGEKAVNWDLLIRKASTRPDKIDRLALSCDKRSQM